MNDTALDYIQQKGWEHRQQSGQIVVKVCPYCQDTGYHLYVNPEDGRHYCHKCNARGNLITLRKYMGDKNPDWIQPAFSKPTYQKPKPDQAEIYHQGLDDETIAYLQERGISRDSVDRFKLGLCRENGTRWFSIPHYQGGELVNIKFRSLPPAEKVFRRVKDCRSILFNSDAVATHKDSIIVTEGELDAITLLQAGFENVVSGTTGAGSFDPEWIDQLKDVKRVYFAYDADDVGQQGARALARRLGYARCFNVELPDGDDVNSYFQEHIKADFETLLKRARQFDLPGVVGIGTGLDLLLREAQEPEAVGLTTPWGNVNLLIKRFSPGDLIILSASPKTGKTSFALEISLHQALQKNPVLFYCLEMRPERLTRKVIQCHYNIEYPGVPDIQKAGNELARLPLYFGHSFKKEKLEDVLSLIREAIQRYDLRLVVFDNLHFLVRSIGNVNEELGQAVQGFKLLAEEMEIPIIGIAQPRKRDISRGDEIMSAEDVKYSNSIHADCDMMIILHRRRLVSKVKEISAADFTGVSESLDPVTLVRVEAHRYGPGGETLLRFRGECSRFEQVGLSARDMF